MLRIKKIVSFSTKSIVYQTAVPLTDNVVPQNLRGKVYDVTIKLTTGREFRFQLMENDWMAFLCSTDFTSYEAPHDDIKVYALIFENDADKIFTTYGSLRKFLDTLEQSSDNVAYSYYCKP